MNAVERKHLHFCLWVPQGTISVYYMVTKNNFFRIPTPPCGCWFASETSLCHFRLFVLLKRKRHQLESHDKALVTNALSVLFTVEQCSTLLPINSSRFDCSREDALVFLSMGYTTYLYTVGLSDNQKKVSKGTLVARAASL